MYKTAYYLFLATLIFSPLAFGTVETWSYTIMQVMICASALLLYLSRRTGTLYQVPGLFPLLLVCAAVLIQVLPLPAGLVGILSPQSHEIYQNSVGSIVEAQWMTISIYPRATVMEFLRVSCYVLFYAIAIQFLAAAPHLKRSLAVISGFAALLAGFVLVEFITRIMGYPLPHDKIMWIRESAHGAGSVGPYVNRNHYAGLMEMIFPVVLGLVLIYHPVTDRGSFRRRILNFFSQNPINTLFLYVTAAILTGASLLTTLSRGGIISITISVGLLALYLITKSRQKRVGSLVAAVCILVIILTGTKAWDLIIDRFSEIRSVSGEINTNRFHYWQDSAGIISDFPLLGAGAGTFEYIYPKYRTFPGSGRLEHAHSDYVEFLSTGGIIISTLMLLALCVIFAKAYQAYKKRRESYSIHIFICCAAAVLSILLHSFVDFNMQVGANGLYFFFILALVVSAAHTRFRNGYAPTYLKPSSVRYYVPLLAVVCLGAGVFHVNFGALMGNFHFAEYRGINIEQVFEQDVSDAALDRINKAAMAAAGADTFNPVYFHVLAEIAASREETGAAARNQAGAYYTKLLRLAPMNSRYLQDAGYFMQHSGRPDAAERLMRAGMTHDPLNSFARITYASLLFEQSRMADGLGVLKSAMKTENNSRFIQACLGLMVWYRLDDDQMKMAMPDRVAPHLNLADYQLSRGDVDAAEVSYITALSHLNNEEQVHRNYFVKVHDFFLGRKAYEKALAVIEQGMKYLPEDRQLHRLADNLKKRGTGQKNRNGGV